MTLTLEQQKANRKLWVEALRSGKYRQAKAILHDGDNGYCCLGVSCEVLLGDDCWELDDAERYYNPRGYKMDHYLPSPLAQKFGLTEGGISRLVHANDAESKSFSEIADIIESEPPGLFTAQPSPAPRG